MKRKMKKWMFFVSVSLPVIFFGCSDGKYNVTSTGFEKVMEYLDKTPGSDTMIDELRFLFNDSIADKNAEIQTISIEFLSKANKNQLERMTYNHEIGWGPVESVQINSDEDEAEMYDFEDEVNSLSLVKANILKKVYENAVNKASEQSSGPLVSSILINFRKEKDVTYEVAVKGRQKNSEEKVVIYLIFGKDGNLIEN